MWFIGTPTNQKIEHIFINNCVVAAVYFIRLNLHLDDKTAAIVKC